MSDKQRDRGSRRRERPESFDDDQPLYFASPSPRPAAPPPAPISDAPILDATVKRFNVERGFGFVGLSDGSPDAFIHVSKLSPDANIAPGTRLRVRVGPTSRGLEVTEVLSIEPDQQIGGVVKWFNVEKGFGFVKPNDGGREVFISLRVVQLAGLAKLVEGQRVEVTVLQATKGPEAGSVRLVDDAR